MRSVSSSHTWNVPWKRAERDEDGRSLCFPLLPRFQWDQFSPAGRTSQYHPYPISYHVQRKKVSVEIIFIKRRSPRVSVPRDKLALLPPSHSYSTKDFSSGFCQVIAILDKKDFSSQKPWANFLCQEIFPRKLGFVAKFQQCNHFSVTLFRSSDIFPNTTEKNFQISAQKE